MRRRRSTSWDSRSRGCFGTRKTARARPGRLVPGDRPGGVTLRSLHEDSIVIDLHTDSLIQARAVGYRLAGRHHNPILGRMGFFYAAPPRLRGGGGTGQFFGLVTFPYPEAGCRDACLRQIEHLRKVSAQEGLVWARSAGDVRRAKREGTMAGFT